jgi:hypothetical protein
LPASLTIKLLSSWFSQVLRFCVSVCQCCPFSIENDIMFAS